MIQESQSNAIAPGGELRKRSSLTSPAIANSPFGKSCLGKIQAVGEKASTSSIRTELLCSRQECSPELMAHCNVSCSVRVARKTDLLGIDNKGCPAFHADGDGQSCFAWRKLLEKFCTSFLSTRNCQCNRSLEGPSRLFQGVQRFRIPLIRPQQEIMALLNTAARS